MIPRFYCPDMPLPLATGHIVSLPDAAAHHAMKVLRLRCDDELVLFDGSGGEYAARVVDAGRQFRVMLNEWREPQREAPLSLTLVQGLPSGDKMDWVVQKAVELGAAAIQPVQVKRSVVRLAGERAEKRAAHWQQVAVAACEQSGRNRIPEVHAILDLPHYLARLIEAGRASDATESAPRLLLSPHHGVRLNALPRPSGSVTLLIGPEGGLEEGEESMARAAGFQAVSLGPRVLRTETAGLAAIAAVMTLWGDF